MTATATPAPGAEVEAGGGRRAARRRPPHGPGALPVGLAVAAVLAVPLVVAAAVLADPRWFPTLDLAMTELRVRDVGTGDTPLIGLSGRIGILGEQGSHPGPLSFYALWPAYRLFGSSPWALQVAAVVLDLAAVAVALWLGARRGGARVALAVGAVLALLFHLYGAEVLTEPWNPHLPVLWWLVLLLAVWSVLDGDLPVLPVAVLAASFCMQTHIPYLAIGGGLAALALGGAVVVGRRAGPDGRRQLLRWGLVAVAVGAVAWLPPVVDQLTNDPGNASKLLDHFGSPPEDEPVLGAGEGVELLLRHLDPVRLVRGDLLGNEPATSVVPGVALLASWLASVVVAARLRLSTLLRLDLVLGVALVLGGVALGRILGFVWYYLSLWAFGVTALLLLAVGWAAAALVARGLPPGRRSELGRLAAGALGAVVLVWAGLTTFDARDVERPDAADSDAVRDLLEPTVTAMEARPEADWLLSWEIDPSGLGAQGFGLLLELERRGFDVDGTRLHVAGSTPQRTSTLEDADAFVHLAIGDDDIAVWRGRPGVREVASVEPRDLDEQAEYERLRTEITQDLDAVGLADLVPTFERIPFVAALDARVPDDLQARIDRLVDLGQPSAVFVGDAAAAEDDGLGIQPLAG